MARTVRQRKLLGSCKFPGCWTQGRLHLGWCNKHYLRYRKHGDPSIVLVEQERHGMRHTPEYNAWAGMVQRATNPNRPDWSHYGLRGITICARYRESFTAFYRDLGKRPGPAYSVDRMNNDGNYSCGRCRECIANGWTVNLRWATKAQQSQNQHRSSNIWGSSRFRDVTWAKDSRKWQASFYTPQASVYIGQFDDEEDAAMAAQLARMELMLA